MTKRAASFGMQLVECPSSRSVVPMPQPSRVKLLHLDVVCVQQKGYFRPLKDWMQYRRLWWRGFEAFHATRRCGEMHYCNRPTHIDCSLRPSLNAIEQTKRSQIEEKVSAKMRWKTVELIANVSKTEFLHSILRGAKDAKRILKSTATG
jgi:hypothetical protein